ncbi:MAG: hypothetical protein HW405_203 [Candidatus Berkelbacteria bacterium]|nr:hypothetical protein [Candidatus Berkelbacteria bacterium]
METFHLQEGSQGQLLYQDLLERLAISKDNPEWWRIVFNDLTQAKGLISDESLIAQIDEFITEYGDLRERIRRDEESMQSAKRVIDVIINRVLQELARH